MSLQWPWVDHAMGRRDWGPNKGQALQGGPGGAGGLEGRGGGGPDGIRVVLPFKAPPPGGAI